MVDGIGPDVRWHTFRSYKVTDPTDATVIDAVFAMNAYEHNPDGSWSFDDQPQINLLRCNDKVQEL